MKIVPCLLTLAVALIASAQSIVSSGDPTTVKLGTAVVGKAEVRLVARFEWVIIDAGWARKKSEFGGVVNQYCLQSCQGGNFKSHADCVQGCDILCSDIHHVAYSGSTEKTLAEFLEKADSIKEGLKVQYNNESKLPYSDFLKTADKGAAQAAKDFAGQMSLDFDFPHFAKGTCEWAEATFGYKVYTVALKIFLDQTMSDGYSLPSWEVICPYQTIYVPDANPQIITKVQCACGVQEKIVETVTPPKEGGDPLGTPKPGDPPAKPDPGKPNPGKPEPGKPGPGKPGTGKPEPPTIPPPTGRTGEPEKPKDPPKSTGMIPPMQDPPGVHCRSGGNVIIPGPQTCSVEFVGCGDPNEVECHITNHTGQPVDCTIEPGTICMSEQDYQRMMIVEFNKKTIPGIKTTLWASLSGGSTEDTVVFKIPALCMDMPKEAPPSGSKMTASLSTPSGLPALSRIAGDDMVGGVRLQAMIWIWSNNATIDDINKRLLFPKCTPGQYLWALSNVAQSGCKPLSQIQKLVSPDAILAWDVKAAPVGWLVHTEDKLDPNGLAGSVEKGIDEMRAKLAKDGPLSDVQHVADVATDLCASESGRLQLAGLHILSKAVPPNDLLDMVRKNALASLPALLVSDDPEVRAAADSVAQQYLDKIDMVNKPLARIVRELSTP